MRSQVTTKRGDSGKSTAMSGDQYPKSHPVFEACGNVDSVRARIAHLSLKILEQKPDHAEEHAEFLLWLIHTGFLIGSHCSDPKNKHPEYRNRDLAQEHLEKLDQFQASLETRVKLPKQFVSSASNELAALTDVLCTEIRKLERSIVALKEVEQEFDTKIILPFVNRMSDTLFMLARDLENGQHTTVDYTVLD